MTEIRIDPVIPIGAIVVLVLMAGIGMWLTFGRCLMPMRHRLVVLGLRMAGILVLAGVLLQPELLRIRKREEKPTLAVLLDTSASMKDSPNQNTDTRIQNANDFLASRGFRSGSKDFRVKWYQYAAELGDATNPKEREPVFNGPRSHLLQAVNELVQRSRGENLAGIVVLTDGLDQSTQNLSSEATQIPLFIPELERKERRAKKRMGDVFIADVASPSMLVVNWKGQVDIAVKRDQPGTRVTCPVNLFRGTELVRSGTLVFEPNDTVKTLNVAIEPTTIGRVTYLVEIKPDVDRRPDNNMRRFAVDVTDPKNRILYLEGTPRWEFKYLKRALLKERNYQLSAFVQSGPGVFINFSEGSGSAEVTDMPDLTDAAALKFRAVILGELTALSMTADQQKSIVKYVEKGGGILFLGGPKALGAEGWSASETMARLLPFTNEDKARMVDGRFAVTTTAGGRTHPIIAGVDAGGGFPEIISLWGRVRKKPDSTVLMETADGAPVLLVKRYGKGKVAALMTESLWAWQLGQARLDDGKSLYEQFVSQIVHWLSPQRKELDESTNLQIVTASAQAEIRQNVVIGAVSGEGGAKMKLSCRISTPDKRTLDFDMLPAKLGADVGLGKTVGGWRCDFTPHIPGDYEIAVREAGSGLQAKTRLLVVEPQLERTGKPISRRFLKRVAEITGGRFYSVTEIDELMDDIPCEPITVTSPEQKPLWNKPWILALMIIIFSAEWYIRSKLDLV